MSRSILGPYNSDSLVFNIETMRQELDKASPFRSNSGRQVKTIFKIDLSGILTPHYAHWEVDDRIYHLFLQIFFERAENFLRITAPGKSLIWKSY